MRLKDIPGLHSVCLFGVCWVNRRRFNVWLSDLGYLKPSLITTIGRYYKVIDLPFGSLAWKRRKPKF